MVSKGIVGGDEMIANRKKVVQLNKAELKNQKFWSRKKTCRQINIQNNFPYSTLQIEIVHLK